MISYIGCVDKYFFFLIQKPAWLGFKINYAACVAGIWSSMSSKPVTYSWNKLQLFIDITFYISQCWLHFPVVFVLDILQTLNKLHSKFILW